MTPRISERAFEETIECALLAAGPDACAGFSPAAQEAADFGEDDRVVIEQLEQKLAGNEALAAAIRANVPENARLTFDHVVTDELQERVETNFDFYRRVTDDQAFARFFLDSLFERLRAGVEGSAAGKAPATQDERAGA